MIITNVKKRCRFSVIIITMFIFVTMLVVSCSSGMITKKTVFENMSAVKEQFSRTSSLPLDRLNVKTGKSGFFYIVSKEGRVVWHPIGYMQGADVSMLPMIKEIFSKESGYGYFDQGGMKRVVFYEPLGDGSKLFLSIDPEEFDEKK
jgi:hypothetical protein